MGWFKKKKKEKHIEWHEVCDQADCPRQVDFLFPWSGVFWGVGGCGSCIHFKKIDIKRKLIEGE